MDGMSAARIIFIAKGTTCTALSIKLSGMTLTSVVIKVEYYCSESSLASSFRYYQLSHLVACSVNKTFNP